MTYDVNITNFPETTTITGTINIENTKSANGEINPLLTNIGNFNDSLDVVVNHEDALALNIAIQLYTYTDFEKVSNLRKHAALCIQRANDFVLSWTDYKLKNKINKVGIPEEDIYVDIQETTNKLKINVLYISEKYKNRTIYILNEISNGNNTNYVYTGEIENLSATIDFYSSPTSNVKFKPVFSTTTSSENIISSNNCKFYDAILKNN